MKKGKYIFSVGILVLILSILPLVSSYITVKANPSSKSGLYAPDRWYTDIKIYNNYECPIMCSIVGEGGFGIIQEGMIKSLNIYVDVRASGNSPEIKTLYVNCIKQSPCSGTFQKTVTLTSSYEYCGIKKSNKINTKNVILIREFVQK